MRDLTKLYVGNFPWNTTEDELRDFFSSFGEVHSVAIIVDRDTGRSRGFGFLEMDSEAATEAIARGDGQELGGRTIRVSEAHEQNPRGDRR